MLFFMKGTVPKKAGISVQECEINTEVENSGTEWRQNAAWQW